MDLLSAQAAIVQRLESATQTGPNAWCRKVGTRDYLASLVEEQQVVPAVYVLYAGPMVLDADEQRANMAHRWLAVVAVGSAAGGRETAPRDQMAGPYIGSVLAALQGLQLPEHTHGLVPMTPPAPYYAEGGKYAYYPLAFYGRFHHSTRFGLAGAAAT